MKTKAIITKYALSSGIRVDVGEMSDSEVSGNRMIRVEGNGVFHHYYHGHEFHLNRASARDRVIAMVEAKRKSLERQLRELDGKMEKAFKMINEADLSEGSAP